MSAVLETCQLTSRVWRDVARYQTSQSRRCTKGSNLTDIDVVGASTSRPGNTNVDVRASETEQNGKVCSVFPCSMIFSHVSLSYVHVLRLCLWVIFGARTKRKVICDHLNSLNSTSTFRERGTHRLANRIGTPELTASMRRCVLISIQPYPLAAYNVIVVR